MNWTFEATIYKFPIQNEASLDSEIPLVKAFIKSVIKRIIL